MNYPEGIYDWEKPAFDEFYRMMATNTISRESTLNLYRWAMSCIRGSGESEPFKLNCGPILYGAFFVKKTSGNPYFDALSAQFVNRNPVLKLWDGSTVQLSLSALQKQTVGETDKYVYANFKIQNLGDVKARVEVAERMGVAEFAKRVYSTQQQLLNRIANGMVERPDKGNWYYIFDAVGVELFENRRSSSLGEYILGNVKKNKTYAFKSCFEDIGMEPLSGECRIEGFCRAIMMMPQLQQPVVESGITYMLKMEARRYDEGGYFQVKFVRLYWEASSAAPLRSW